jgi:tetratricopeptide (TPR) repeat protein
MIFETNTKLAEFFFEHEQTEVAIPYFEIALDAAKKITKEYHFEIEATWNLGNAIRRNGRMLDAMNLYEKALDLSRIKEDREKEDICLEYLMETLIEMADEVRITKLRLNQVEISSLRFLTTQNASISFKQKTRTSFHLRHA